MTQNRSWVGSPPRIIERIHDGDDEIGELTLILDTNLKIIDENWSLDIESPFVVAKIQPVCSILPKVREG